MIRTLSIFMLLSASFLSLSGMDYLHAAIITVPASVDGDIQTATTTIENGLDVVNISLNRVGIFEFDLAAQIPAGSTIIGAKFLGFSEQVANLPVVQLLGFEATTPAAITLADASVGATNLLSVNDPTGDSDFTFTFPNISSLQLALDGSGIFGLRAERFSANGTWRIRSNESTGPFPRLEIEYSAIPEPSTFVLVAFVIFGAVICARRRV